MNRRKFLLGSTATIFGAEVTRSAPCPPSTVSITGGSIANSNCSQVSPLIDWQSRSKESGVFYASNFSEFSTRTDLINGAYQTLYANDQYGTSGRFKTELEEKIKLSGKGVRFNLFAAEGANERGGTWAFSFDGVGAKTQNIQKDEFYYQFAIYSDSTWANHPYANGSKITIVAMPDKAFDQAASAGVNELLFQRTTRGAYPEILRYSTAAVTGLSRCALEWYKADGSFLSNYTWHPFINNDPTDTTRPSNTSQLANRFGMTQYDWDPSIKDPNKTYSPKIATNGWTVFQIYVNRTYNGTGMIKVWSAPYGETPILWGGTSDARILSNNDNSRGYSGITLLARTENAWEGTWPTVDTFICFGEVICSDNPIKFPGGFSISYPGTNLPPNYPWNGAKEVVDG